MKIKQRKVNKYPKKSKKKRYRKKIMEKGQVTGFIILSTFRNSRNPLKIKLNFLLSFHNFSRASCLTRLENKS